MSWTNARSTNALAPYRAPHVVNELGFLVRTYSNYLAAIKARRVLEAGGAKLCNRPTLNSCSFENRRLKVGRCQILQKMHEKVKKVLSFKILIFFPKVFIPFPFPHLIFFPTASIYRENDIAYSFFALYSSP